MLSRLSPVLFVLLWSTGWISARAAEPYADPLTFLVARYLLAAGALTLLAVATGAAWPRGMRAIGHATASGVLLHAVYLGSVWWAIGQGVPAGVSGVIAALQPLLTALLSPSIAGEAISRRQWVGIGLGLVGITLVLLPRLAAVEGQALGPLALPIALNIAGMVSVTLGTFYQKRLIGSGDLRTLTALQYVAAAAVTLPVAMATESLRIEWNVVTVVTMAWAVLALSLGAIALLISLLRQGAVARAAALIYLVPPAVALEAMVLFGETLSPVQVLGMAVTATGVALAVRQG
jgi:drug/metabolite transporter (DMT)-like permease